MAAKRVAPQAEDSGPLPTLVERAYHHVKDRIMDLSFKPGESVTDGGVAAQLEISRTPVREAMRRLERDGLLLHTPHHGWRVRTLQVPDIEEIFELKECLESLLLRQAIRRMTPERAAALQALTARMEDAAARKDRQDWLAADDGWHDTLYAAAHNLRARQIASSINAQWRCMQAGLIAMEERMGQSAVEHRAILERVLAGDEAGAEELLREQFLRARQYLVNLLKDLILPFALPSERRGAARR